MKLKLLLLSSICLAFAVPLFANTVADSIGVENLNGKKIILHKLDPKDNYYSIGRKYGVSPKAIIQFNNNAKMAIGAIIKVPTERSIVETVGSPATQTATPTAAQQPATNTQPKQSKPVAQQPVTTAPPTPKKPVVPQPVTQPAQNVPKQPNGTANGITTQQYKVSQGETLYAIAKRFGTTVEDISALNNLKTSIQPGQVLQVQTGTPAPAPQPTPQSTTTRIDSLLVKRDSTYVSPDSLIRNSTSRYGLFEKSEKGVATWIDDTSLDPNKKLILHRTAPIGTVMRITNPMNNKTTFAKVVGRFTDNQSNKDAVIVMTKNVAQALGALDKRFLVNISYGTPNE
jgi:LysM repeat protein